MAIPTMKLDSVDPELLNGNRPFHTIVRLPEGERNYMLLMMAMASAKDGDGNYLPEGTAHHIMVLLRRMSIFLNCYDEFIAEYPDSCCLPEDGLEAIYMTANLAEED